MVPFAANKNHFAMNKLIVLALLVTSLTVKAYNEISVNVTAGNLSKTLTVLEKQTITSLRITGSIDARDFVVLRDSLVLLDSLNIKDVIISEYNGNQGTDNDVTRYPENSIPDYAFFNPNLGRRLILSFIDFPSSLESIGDAAFCNSNLRSINFPPFLFHIGKEAFSFCNKADTVRIPVSCQDIDDMAFIATSGYFLVDENPRYSSLDGVLYSRDKTTLIQCPVSKIGHFEIPESVIKIGKASFCWCSKLTSVSLPSQLTRIEELAFDGCDGLSSITFPEAVNYVGGLALYNCSNLKSLYLKNSEPPTLTYLLAQKVYKFNLFVPFGSKIKYQSHDFWKEYDIFEVPGIIVSTLNTSLSDTANSKTTVIVFSNIDWSAQVTGSWISLDKAQGINIDTITIVAEANLTGFQRIGTITISADKVDPQIITVTQVAGQTTHITDFSFQDSNENTFEFHVFPNPAYEKLWVRCHSKNGGPIKFEFIDNSGKIILSEIRNIGTNQFDLSGFRNGIYYLRMFGSTNSISRKIIVN